jgi:iturin family lipopeptide synthetase A
MDAYHIAIDGSSYAILMPELITLYNGGQLSPLPTSYSAYDLWEQERIGSPAMGEQETYWLERFGNDPAILELPIDYPRDHYQRFAGKVLRHPFYASFIVLYDFVLQTYRGGGYHPWNTH